MIRFRSFIFPFVFFVAAALTLAAQVVNQEETQRLSHAYKRAQPLFLKGQALLVKGKLDKAADKLREALEVMPEHADAHYLLGEILYRQKDFAAAQGRAETAVKNFRLISGLETIVRQIHLDRIRDQRQSLDATRTALEGQLAQARTSGERSSIQSQLNELNATIGALQTKMNEPVADFNREPAEYHALWGNARFRLRDFDGALEQYRLAVEINPRCGDAWNNLANIHFIRREHAAALECLEKAESSGARINPEFKAALLKALGK